MGKYRCTVCGYVYEPGVPFADLPEDWVCPVCKAGKEKFEESAPTLPVTRRYTNGEITILWQPALCNHNGNCTKTLPQVFNTKARPWVDITAADSATIAKVVAKCPTGALTIVPTP
jgi:uncharacterized Fe-S cluster protein YjdI